MAKPGTTKPGMAEPGTTKPGMAKPGTTRTGMTFNECDQAENGQAWNSLE
jgi:hypothetical protein